MQNLLYLAIAPIIIFLTYIYIKDRYEKEPKKLAFKCFLYGIFISLLIMITEKYLITFAPKENSIYYPFFISFIVASFVEETYKYIILYLLIYKNKNFNEPFDGILYAVFISLGFAFIENIIYVLNPILGGINTGLLRGIFSVPAHGIFGIYMGYYLAMYKFINNRKSILILSYIIPILIHGLYDIFLFSNVKYSNIFFLIFFIYIAICSILMINKYIKISPFKNK